MSAPYPFTAILGQESMQTALLISAVDHAIGGVLIRGQKGTAKSTAARALAGILPAINVVENCLFHCNPDTPDERHAECHASLKAGKALQGRLIPTPFVDLPLSTTEDRLVGTLHLQNTLLSGQRQFEPGLLASAHRGILYVDEVNLLPDHLVDLLLDSATSGENLVEREGLQYSHASRFILVGTMNPEEGELRPQFLDRFGLCVTINSLEDQTLRSNIVTKRLAFDKDPVKFMSHYESKQSLLRKQISAARKRLEQVELPEDIIQKAVALATAAGAQGHRAELALVRAARALAALMDRDRVTQEDLSEVSAFALSHRFPGASVPNDAEVRHKLADALQETKPDKSVRSKKALDDLDDLPLMENIDFPGSAAAGGMLFTYLKKKLMTASSASTNL